jgi:major intracellular serine protease
MRRNLVPILLFGLSLILVAFAINQNSVDTLPTPKISKPRHFVRRKHEEARPVGPKEWSRNQYRSAADREIQRLDSMLGKSEASVNPVTVAIIDTGIDTDNVYLRSSLWVNKGESGIDQLGHDKSNNQIDDDRNGFIDDVHGWNFAGNNNSIEDFHGHGTNVAGLIRDGSSGLGNSRVNLMVLKFYSGTMSEEGNIEKERRAISYATKMGAKIINISAGGNESNQGEFLALLEAQKNGIAVVAAAGNSYRNSDVNSYYPADYNLDNIISVAALDSNGLLIAPSNYGIKTVHVATLGLDVCSEHLTGGYSCMTGTSQAAAQVTAGLASILSQRPTLRPSRLRDFVVAGADPVPELKDKIKSGGSFSRLGAVYQILAEDSAALNESIGLNAGINSSSKSHQASAR